MTTNNGALKAQTAVVTGAGRGIGRAIAKAVAARGATVALIARNVNELAETCSQITSGGGRAQAFVADVTDIVAISVAVNQIEELFGPVDLLVNNAGLLQPIGPFWENDLNEWLRGIDVNLRGVAICSRAVMPGMVARGRGRIINVSSGAGLGMGLDYMSSYVTSKTAVLRFTECIASEAKPHGVYAFTISPGPVRTAMGEFALNSPEGEKWLPWYSKLYEDGRDFPPERAAELVVKLASGAADMLSGRYFAVTDDVDVMVTAAERIAKDELYFLRLKKI
jgi:NAD(P)-dependent dehydrogenase (short-subunit alcohol dehydrogenase family)